ncbi:uncharacterized protein LOC135709533 [Ochlerotatus camptorhynchus]|uniref:uncharacterized protein LOC135709533 n=1 Tax=Ochlerotatus camptorhynchus TaxID=644619 RepID=UPI0031D2E246
MGKHRSRSPAKVQNSDEGSSGVPISNRFAVLPMDGNIQPAVLEKRSKKRKKNRGQYDGTIGRDDASATNGDFGDAADKEHAADISEAVIQIRGFCAATMRKQQNYQIKLEVCSIAKKITKSQCGCVAGAGNSSACKHIAALLCCIEDFITTGVVLQDEGCTNALQIWHRPPKNAPRKSVNEPINNIFSVPFTPKTSLRQGDATERLMNLTVAYNLNPSMHWSLQANMHGIANDHQYLEKSIYETTVDRLNFVDEALVINMEELTRGQNTSPKWFEARKSRLTASRIKDVITAMQTASKKSTACSVIPARFNFKRATLQNIPAIAWGTKHEDIAFKGFINHRYNSKTFRKCGIYIDTRRHYLAASPDAISECGNEIVEIKCPYSIRYSEAVKAPFLDTDGHLKPNHKYFYQIQTQMHVTQTKVCHFVVYTLKGIHTEIVQYDKEFMDKVLPTLDSFYKNVFCEEYCKTFGFEEK